MGIGIGYVEFLDESYVAEAVALNGGTVASRPVRVSRCHKSGTTLSKKNRNATVGRSGKRQKVGEEGGKRYGNKQDGKSFMGSKAEQGVIPKKSKKSKDGKKKSKKKKKTSSK